MKRPNHPKYWPCLLIAMAMLTGCAGTRTSKPTYYYTLDYPPPGITVTARLPFVLRVDRFAVTPPYDTRRMIYADKGLHRNAYAHYQWVAAPGEMLAFFLGRDLRDSQAFDAVLPPDAAAPPTHVIKGWIDTFLEEDFASTGQASLTLSIILMDANETDATRRILFQHSYAAKTDCAAKTPAALAEAMSLAASSVSARMAQDIYDTLGRMKKNINQTGRRP